MDVQMHLKVLNAAKSLPTLLTLDEFLFPFVDFLVLDKG